jgi:hypothetical protein
MSGCDPTRWVGLVSPTSADLIAPWLAPTYSPHQPYGRGVWVTRQARQLVAAKTLQGWCFGAYNGITHLGPSELRDPRQVTVERAELKALQAPVRWISVMASIAASSSLSCV